jgi:hypothetical protein
MFMGGIIGFNGKVKRFRTPSKRGYNVVETAEK